MAQSANLRRFLVRQADNVLLGTFGRVQNFRRRRICVKIFSRALRDARNVHDLFFRRKTLRQKNRIRGGNNFGNVAGILVLGARRDNRHDSFGYVLAHADDFLFGLSRKKSAAVFNFVRGLGRGGFDERSDRIFFAGLDHLNFFGVAGRFAALEKTFPREKFFAARRDNFNLVLADDADSRRGLFGKFFGRA